MSVVIDKNVASKLTNNGGTDISPVHIFTQVHPDLSQLITIIIASLVSPIYNLLRFKPLFLDGSIITLTTYGWQHARSSKKSMHLNILIHQVTNIINFEYKIVKSRRSFRSDLHLSLAQNVFAIQN